MRLGQLYTGIKGDSFRFILPIGAFALNDVITLSTGKEQYQVIKVYKYNWWRKLLVKIGMSVKIMQIKKL